MYLHNAAKIKVIKKSINGRNQGFSYLFCMTMEGFGAGSLLVTNGCGSESATLAYN